MINREIAYLYDSEDIITPINEKHSLIHIKNTETKVCDLGVHPYTIFPSIYTLNATINLEKTEIEKIQRNPNLALFGQGVLVGIIDTGIDYRHPAFLNSDGTSRILSIWDQTIQDGKPPEGFSFGTEYTKEQINKALKSDNPLSIVPSIDEIGHGTAIASVAAGSKDLDNEFSGIASSAEFVVVKLKPAKKNMRTIFFISEEAICYQESDVLFAARYLTNVSTNIKYPLSLCIAFGTSQGGHDGRGAGSSYFSYISQMPQIGVAIAAGNEANEQRHYFGRVDSASFTKNIELKISNKDKKFAFEIWCYAPGRLSVEVMTPGGEIIHEVLPSFNECRKFSFIYESSVVWINNIIVEAETGDQMILVRMENPLAGIWKFKVRNLENEVSSFHAWLPAGNLISRETFFIESNPNTTITSPGNALNPMTVTAYNEGNNSILLESGRGYTRSNVVKPDFAAPGFELTCATLNGKYGKITGTGAAAAYTAGIIAMILEWAVLRGNYTSITGNEISSFLKRGAERDGGIVYPNNTWGYGKIDINTLFQKLS
ncbi:S8 family peptidase [Lachnospiraceae bacterium LCP25S3_G4]